MPNRKSHRVLAKTGHLLRVAAAHFIFCAASPFLSPDLFHLTPTALIGMLKA
jgi:hypothetical protein